MTKKTRPDFLFGAFKKLKREKKACINSEGELKYKPKDLLDNMTKLRDEYLLIVEGEQ